MPTAPHHAGPFFVSGACTPSAAPNLGIWIEVPEKLSRFPSLAINPVQPSLGFWIKVLGILSRYPSLDVSKPGIRVRAAGFYILDKRPKKTVQIVKARFRAG
jgi:hypothetical protein